jgi:hypothetical protein
VAAEPQSLDSIPLIRRKRGGEGETEAAAATPTVAVRPPPAQVQPPAEPVIPQEDASALRMKPRETVQLAAVHVRIPEHLARGLKLMSVLESKQSQVIVAEMLEEHLAKWNPRWKDSVVTKGG